MAATGTFKLFGNAPLNAWSGKFNLPSDTIKVCASANAPDQDAWDFFNDVTGEVTGTNWPSGGVSVGTVTVGYTGGTNTVKIDHPDIVVSTVTASGMAYMIWYDDTPATAATKPLLGYLQWSVALSPVAGTVTITIDSAGLFTDVVA